MKPIVGLALLLLGLSACSDKNAQMREEGHHRLHSDWRPESSLHMRVQDTGKGIRLEPAWRHYPAQRQTV